MSLRRSLGLLLRRLLLHLLLRRLLVTRLLLTAGRLVLNVLGEDETQLTHRDKPDRLVRFGFVIVVGILGGILEEEYAFIDRFEPATFDGGTIETNNLHRITHPSDHQIRT